MELADCVVFAADATVLTLVWLTEFELLAVGSATGVIKLNEPAVSIKVNEF